MDEVIKLLPCPFCGSEPELREDPDDSGPRVYCDDCELDGPRAFWSDFEDNSWALAEAARKWNTRFLDRIKDQSHG